MKLIKLITTITLSIAILFTPVLPVFASEDNLNKIAPNQQISLPISQSNLAIKKVKVIKVSKITLPKEPVNIVSGYTKQLFPTIYPANADNQNITWKSSKPSIATVDSNGIASGWSTGKATITVTTVDGKKTAKCTINVNMIPAVKVTGISLNKSSLTMDMGASEQLVATISPSNATIKDVIWTSSNPSIVSAYENGNIMSFSSRSGTSDITATTMDGSKIAVCKVTVVNQNVVKFKDPNFEKAIRNNLNKPYGDIDTKDLQKINTLSISNESIYDISEIEYMTYLANFSLFNSSVSDISKLSGLYRLRNISLGNNQIADITPLKNLYNLQSIDLGNLVPSSIQPHQNNISDVSALSGLTKLWYLGLLSNNISNIEPLKSMDDLLIMSLGGNPISSADKQSLKTALPKCSITF